MDKLKDRPIEWSWLPAAMPGVARLLAEKKVAYGKAHVAECWRRGVTNLEPGWFFVREGAIAVGTPWNEPDMVNFAAMQITSTQALVCLREPGAVDGAH